MAAICFDDVSKVYGDGTCAVDGLDLEIQEGEFMVFVGPSGCGKTTALRMVAGLEEISSGRVVIGERAVNDVSPKDRDIAMVFQNYALYPHMTVAANLAFGLKLRQLSKQEIERRVSDAAAALDLQDYLERKPKALSGGQRQRVALGRAIVREPAAFLMDEPLSNLDAALRVQTRGEILKLQRRLGTTTIYVTHDQVEAMTMGDRIAVMRKGVLQQIGTPQELYTRPANTFVAGFIGSPAMNLVPASAIGIDRDGLLAGFRPEHLTLAGAPRRAGGGHGPGAGREGGGGHGGARVGFGFEAIVELVEYLGDERLAHVRLGERLLTAKLPADAQLATGAAVAFTVPSEAVLLFDADTGQAVDSPR